MNWQAINTAPKDGRFVWLIEHGAWTGLPRTHQVMAYWKSDDRLVNGGYWAEAIRPNIAIQATHWMPLPSAPNEYD